jgi:hypothetical protein
MFTDDQETELARQVRDDYLSKGYVFTNAEPMPIAREPRRKAMTSPRGGRFVRAEERSQILNRHEGIGIEAIQILATRGQTVRILQKNRQIGLGLRNLTQATAVPQKR